MFDMQGIEIGKQLVGPLPFLADNRQLMTPLLKGFLHKNGVCVCACLCVCARVLLHLCVWWHVCKCKSWLGGVCVFV